MISRFKVFRFAGIILCAAIFFTFLIYPFLKGRAAEPSLADTEKEMEQVKSLLEQRNSSPVVVKRYNRLLKMMRDCEENQVIAPFNFRSGFSPTSSLCVNGSLGAPDPTFNRPLANSSGSGLGASCTLSGSAIAVFYDSYNFNLSGCAVFPTVVTVSLCGPAGCAAAQSMDTVLLIYRNVAAGDPLTANGGLPNVFVPASSCTNARALNDDTVSVPTSPGGSTCDQLNTSDCTASCSLSTSLSQMKRSLGDGRFTVVVTTFSNGATGNYNLYVDAPAAGCTVALAPTAASGSIGGRVSRADGNGIYNAIVTISGGSLPAPVSVKTNPFGYYSFGGLSVGEIYVVTVSSKTNTFANPSRVISLQDSAGEIDFISQ